MAPSGSAIENAPVSCPIRSECPVRMSTGSAACAIATAAPASRVPANSAATPPAPRSASAPPVATAQTSSTRSIA